MTVTGEEAKFYDAVRLDDFASANQGELLEADDQTGLVRWKDVTGEIRVVTLGPQAIRLMRKRR